MFWERFYSLCEEKGLKPNPVGKDIGVSSGIITKWKQGTIPSGEILIKISDYFDCSIDYLLGRDKFVISQKNTDYDKLDIEDKAEIRGMIKQMLKADKYKKNDSYAQSVHDFDNALDITTLFEQCKVDKD